MNWDEMAPREKIELIVRNVLRWKYFPEWDIKHTARWALEGKVTWPYAFWNGPREGICVFYAPDEYARSFNPLESMDDAWQVIEKMKTYHRPLPVDATKQDLTIADIFLVTLWESIDKRGMDALFEYTPEIICKAALQACGVSV